MISYNKIEEYKIQAKQILSKQLSNIILIQIITTLLSNIIVLIVNINYLNNQISEKDLLMISYISSIFISIPLIYGTNKYLYNCIINKPKFMDIFSCIKDGYIKIIGTLLLGGGLLITYNIFYLVVTLILSFIFMYSHYVLVKYPNLCFADTIIKTFSLSKNNRFNGLLIDLSFMPLILLSIPLLLIPLIYVIPYLNLTKLLFINDIDNNSINLNKLN